MREARPGLKGQGIQAEAGADGGESESRDKRQQSKTRLASACVSLPRLHVCCARCRDVCVCLKDCASAPSSSSLLLQPAAPPPSLLLLSLLRSNVSACVCRCLATVAHAPRADTLFSLVLCPRVWQAQQRTTTETTHLLSRPRSPDRALHSRSRTGKTTSGARLWSGLSHDAYVVPSLL